ncbi:MAG: AAA family ATPase [Tissierellia bacterium]|nr:AAA family ATPase [Tissierellia bacterium]
MEILSLELINFGQFKNKYIDIKPGINIIHGYNEAGKTTISDFIFGMFYDFIKPGRKRTVYLEKKDRYRPIQGPYRGAMECRFQGRGYRLERNFEKGQEELRIFLVDEGREITDEINLFQSSRIPQCGHYFLGFGQEIFTNTSYIGQLNLFTPSMEGELQSLWNELNHKEEGSIRNQVIKRLEDKREEIGRTSRKSTEIGSLRFSLEENEKKQKELLPYIRKYRGLEHDLSVTLDIKKKLEEAKSSLNQLAEEWKDYKKYQDYKEFESLKDRKKNLERKLKLGPIFTQEFLEERDIYIKNRGELRLLYPQLDACQLEYSKISTEDKSLDSKDCELFRNLEKPKDNIQEKEKRLSLKENSKNKIDKKKNKDLVLGICLFVLSIVIAIWLYTFKKSLFSLPILLGIGILIKLSIKNSRRRKEFHLLEYEINSLKEEINKYYKNKEIWEKFWEKMSIKYDFSSVEEGISLFYRGNGKDIERDKRRKELIFQMKELEDRISKLEKDQKEFSKKYPKVKEDDLEKAHRLFEEQKDIEKELALISQSIKKMEDHISNHEMTFKELPKQSYEEVENQLTQVENEQIELEKEMIRINEGLHQLEGYMKSWANLREERLQLEEKFKELDKMKRALDLTIKGFIESSKRFGNEYQKEFKNMLNDYLSIMTEERYDSFIMNNGNPSIMEKDTMIRKDGPFLSTGTLDQVYLAYRLAMAKYFGGGKSPLLLDDTMNHFDHKRLLQTWKLLDKIGKKRQIIFFTSRKEEFPPSFVSYYKIVLEEKI